MSPGPSRPNAQRWMDVLLTPIDGLGRFVGRWCLAGTVGAIEGSLVWYFLSLSRETELWRYAAYVGSDVTAFVLVGSLVGLLLAVADLLWTRLPKAISLPSVIVAAVVAIGFVSLHLLGLFGEYSKR